ncbi:MAG: VTT domain-containing protein [Bacteroidia bacterium]
MLDFILHIDKHLEQIIANYGTLTYLILFFIIFAETGFVVTPFLPGDSLLFAAGALAAREGANLNVWLLIILLIVAAFVGNLVNYFIGNYVGPTFLEKEKIPFIKKSHIEKTQAFYDKYGALAIVTGRFAPIIRTFVPFVAGIGKMDWKKYVLYTLVGAVAWVGSITILGYLIGNLPWVKAHFSAIAIGIILISVLPSVWIAAKEYFKW